MVHSLKIDPTHGLASLDCAGRVGLEDVVCAMQEIREHLVTEGPVTRCLCDAIGAEIVFDDDDVQLHLKAGADARLGVKLKCALAVRDSDPERIAAMRRLLESHLGPIAVLPTRQEAIAWLTGDAGFPLDNPCRFRWIPAEQLLLESLRGPITLEDLLAMKESELAAGIVEGGIRGLSDLREARFLFGAAGLRQFVDWCAEHPSHMENSRWSLLVDDPRETSLTMLYQELRPFAKDSEIFSTVEAALAHVGMSPQEWQRHADFFGGSGEQKESGG